MTLMTSPPSFHLGKLPTIADPRSLKLSRYLLPLTPTLPPTLPTPPPVVNYNGPPSINTMLLNDRLGNCVITAMIHYTQQMAAADGNPIPVPTEEEVIQNYSEIGGYVPGDSSTDRGCVMLHALKHWRNTGLLIAGARHKIGAFATVDYKDPVEFQTALYLFGGIFSGFALPTAIQSSPVWPRPSYTCKWRWGSWGGHAVTQSAYDRSIPNIYSTKTWGMLVPTHQKFVTRYCDEAYVVLSESWLGPDNLCPAGVDQARLLLDLEEITRN